MTEKRFIEFSTQNIDNGEINNGFNDIKTGEWYYTKDSENSKGICGLLNALHEENLKLKEYVEKLVNADAHWEKKARQRVKELEEEDEKLENKLWNCQNFR